MTDNDEECCGCGDCYAPIAMGPFGENVPGKGACLICWPAECRCPRIVQGSIGTIDFSRVNWDALKSD